MDINITVTVPPCKHEGNEADQSETPQTCSMNVTAEPPEETCCDAEGESDSPETPEKPYRHVIPVVSSPALDGRFIMGYGFHDDEGEGQGSHLSGSKIRYRARIEAIAYSLEQCCKPDTTIVIYVDDDFAEQLRCYIDYWKRNDWRKRDSTELAARRSWERIYAMLPCTEVIVANLSALTDSTLLELREEAMEAANRKANRLRSEFNRPSYKKSCQYTQYLRGLRKPGRWRRRNRKAQTCNAQCNDGSEVRAPVRRNWGVCPMCLFQLITRTAKSGPHKGNHFIGCTGYPRCRFTRPIPNIPPSVDSTR